MPVEYETYEWWPDEETSVELALWFTRYSTGGQIGPRSGWSQPADTHAEIDLLNVEVLTLAGPSPQPSEQSVEQAFLSAYLADPDLRERVTDKCLS